MKGEGGRVIYVGKANSLRHRVRSYFSGRPASPKVAAMCREIVDIEWILTGNEVEALLLESNYIKKYRPRFNILLRDDKQYPYLKLTVDEEWPRLILVRKVSDDKAKYYGPFPALSLKTIFKMIRRLLPIRWCPETPMKMRSQPCLYYHIKQCIGPCIDPSMGSEYGALVRGIDLLLSGHFTEMTEKMRADMLAASERHAFEEAALLRDRIRALEGMTEDQRVVASDLGDRDVVAVEAAGPRAVFIVLSIREGKLVHRNVFPIADTQGAPAAALLETLLLQYYSAAIDLPKEIILPDVPDNLAALKKWFAERAAKLIIARGRSKMRKLMELARQNALHELEQRVAAELGEAEIDPAVIDLQNALHLAAPPWRIECFDISHISGSNTVGSMVVFENGKPLKSDYRKFKVRLEQTPDDVRSIYEVVSRRYGGSLKDTLDTPDLVVIDGGIGQVGAAAKALKELGAGQQPLIGLAKKLEEIYFPQSVEPLKLPRIRDGLKLLQRARDEAHRFAVTYHRSRRSRSFLGSRSR